MFWYYESSVSNNETSYQLYCDDGILSVIHNSYMLITHLKHVEDFIHLNRDKRRDNFYLCASFLMEV